MSTYVWLCACAIAYKKHKRCSELLQAWQSHFCSLSKTKITGICVDQAMQTHMVYDSLTSEDCVFNIDEVEQAIKHLRTGKAAGPDEIAGEHLKFGGGMLRTWITQVFNGILSLGRIPSSFNSFHVISGFVLTIGVFCVQREQPIYCSVSAVPMQVVLPSVPSVSAVSSVPSVPI